MKREIFAHIYCSEELQNKSSKGDRMTYKRIYFVDVENIGACIKVDSDDLVYLFTSKKAVYKGVLTNNIQEIFVPHIAKKDALDFVIDSWLGYAMMHYGRGVDYIIKSADTGFEVVAQFWQSKGYSVTVDSSKQLSDSEQFRQEVEEKKKNNKKKSDNKITKELSQLTNKTDTAKVEVINKNVVILDIGLSDTYNVKVTNVYRSWVQSRKKSKPVLYQQLSSVLKRHTTKQDIRFVCEELYKIARG